MARLSQEEFQERADKAHGDSYNHKNTVYTKAHDYIEVVCPRHGAFKIKAHGYLAGKGCAKCGNGVYTTEEFRSKCSSMYGSLNDYSETVYVNKHTKVKIVCKEHGPYEVLPRGALHGTGCMECFKKKISSIKSGTQEEFLDLSYKAHKDTYDYSKAVYISDMDYVNIICKKHGEFTQRAGNHKHGAGCRKCKDEKTSILKTISQEQYVSDCVDRHGDKYSYEKTVYKNSQKKVIITCPIHGDFQLHAFIHRAGRGCQKCTGPSGGYSPNKAGSLYVMKSGDILKIGITNKSPSQRSQRISKSSGMEFEVVTSIRFSDGNIPDIVESILLRELREHHEQPTEKFDGYTECFLNVDIGKLITRIGQIAGETFNELNTKE